MSAHLHVPSFTEPFVINKKPT